ncbi:MAG: hypothetical protein U1E65_21385 [Myxococcota bacterium]
MRRLIVFSLTLSACAPFSKSDCARLAEELERCDLPPAEILCEALGERAQRFLRAKMEESSCQALVSEDPGDLDISLCEALGWPCPGPLFGPPPKISTHYPLVFVSGIDDHAVLDWSPRILSEVAQAGPHQVEHLKLTPWSVPEVRAADLAQGLEWLAAGDPQQKFNLICYAVAGIDCRYLVSPGGLYHDDPGKLAQAQARVASITTISTPHRGTRVANEGLDLDKNVVAEVLRALRGGDFLKSDPDGSAEPPTDTAVEVSLSRLTPKSMAAFNQVVTDPPGILIQSYAGLSHIFGQPFVPSEADLKSACAGPEGELLLARQANTYDVMSELFLATAPFSSDREEDDLGAVLRPTDGMVSVHSARWGNFRGCIPADHYDVIGQIADRGPDVNSGFDAAVFYGHLAADLARRGF